MTDEDYKTAITQMLIKINQNHLLKMIYTVVKVCYKKAV